MMLSDANIKSEKEKKKEEERDRKVREKEKEKFCCRLAILRLI